MVTRARSRASDEPSVSSGTRPHRRRCNCHTTRSHSLSLGKPLPRSTEIVWRRSNTAQFRATHRTLFAERAARCSAASARRNVVESSAPWWLNSTPSDQTQSAIATTARLSTRLALTHDKPNQRRLFANASNRPSIAQRLIAQHAGATRTARGAIAAETSPAWASRCRVPHSLPLTIVPFRAVKSHLRHRLQPIRSTLRVCPSHATGAAPRQLASFAIRMATYVIGRPVCECDPLDGWHRDDVVGCRAWANRTVCTDKVINATMACQQESMARREWVTSSTRKCANAQITRDCMARAQAASCTFGQNTMANVCNVTELVYNQSAPIPFSFVQVPCDCTDSDAGFGLFCNERACTREHSEGGAVHFCQCVREHIACLKGHFGSLVMKCNASDPIGGSYAAICPDLCKVLPLYTAAPLPTTTPTTLAADEYVNAVGASSAAQAIIVAMTIVVAVTV
jgi:hypothetical protein